MTAGIPHPIPYQGSKRRLARLILSYAPGQIDTLYEPFAGSAAITLAAAARNAARKYAIGDSLESLAQLWKAIIYEPEKLAYEYQEVWEAQLRAPGDHYLRMRAEYNRSGKPVNLLYLMARCVKNAIRFNARGEFNQSADHRRSGMSPCKMRWQIKGASNLLARRCSVECADYQTILDRATDRDLVYMDPPYQGVSEGAADRRYYQQLNLDRFIENLGGLNRRRVPFLLSFDGSSGPKQYGGELPKSLRLSRVLVNTGRSSQATLNGTVDHTVESIYLSEGLGRGGAMNVELPRKEILLSSADAHLRGHL